LALDWPTGSVDAAIAARLFTVVDPTRAVSEIHRVLRPGGVCFLAEPTSTLGTFLPFALLGLAGWLVEGRTDQPRGEPSGQTPRRLAASTFLAAVRALRWRGCTTFNEDGYLYAVCQKPSGDRA
jgi:hypothetical protein